MWIFVYRFNREVGLKHSGEPGRWEETKVYDEVTKVYDEVTPVTECHNVKVTLLLIDVASISSVYICSHIMAMALSKTRAMAL